MTKSGLCFTLLLGTAVAFGQGPGGQRGWGGGPRMAGPGGGPGMMGPIMGGPGSRVPVTGAPFSGVETTQIQQKLGDGNVISRQETTTIYRDSQGRVRMEHTATPHGSQTEQTRITIFDPVGGFSYVLNPADKTARKMTLPPAPVSGTGTGFGHARGPRKGSDPATTKTEDLGAKSINNVPATGTRVTTTIPAGAIGNQQPISIVRETWIGTTLKIPVQMTSSDPRFGSTTMNLGNIVQAEPNLNLFVVPADYTVTTVTGMGPGGGGGGRAPNHRQPSQD